MSEEYAEGCHGAPPLDERLLTVLIASSTDSISLSSEPTPLTDVPEAQLSARFT